MKYLIIALILTGCGGLKGFNERYSAYLNNTNRPFYAVQAQMQAQQAARNRSHQPAADDLSRNISTINMVGQSSGFVPVYDSAQCAGGVVSGVCYGDAMGPPKAACHGDMVFGKCIGVLIKQ